MDSAGFLADLERKPEVLGALADLLDRGDWVPSSLRVPGPVLLLGMGSSTYAAGVGVARLRAHGVDAYACLASSRLLPPSDVTPTVVAISASGTSRETLDAVGAYRSVSRLVGLTNRPDSTLAAQSDEVWLLHAEPEVGGVACRSYQHTVVAMLALEAVLSGAAPAGVATTVRRSAEACADLLDRRGDWLPDVASLLGGPDGTAVVAPAHRASSAQQSALMLREGPRRPAVACETGDWSHVDVYLTKTLDYRMLLLPGSAYEDELFGWTRERGSTVVVVGEDRAEAELSVRYRFDDDDDVRLLTEVLVAELVAQQWWVAR